jgi:adenosylhomocysteine nucleosidase
VTDLIFSYPCVLFALRRESAFFRREFPVQQGFPGSLCRAQLCGPSWLTVLVLETGLGAHAVESALGWLLSEPRLGNVPYRPALVLSAGFSGALCSDLDVGDLVLADEVADTAGNRWPATWPGPLPPGEWRPPLRRGRLLTAPALAGAPEAKRQLGVEHDALAVDMETAVIARLCQRHGVPFGCLRAISDRQATPLSPGLVDVLSGGRVLPWRLAGALLRRPGLLPELWRLAGQTRRAARQLALGLGEVLTLTLPWMDEGG